MNPGDYTFAVIEFDSTVQIAQTANIFTNGTCWVNWPTTPMGGWANIEAFGAGFAKPFVIRPNFGTTSSGIVSLNEEKLIVYPNPASDKIQITGLGNLSQVRVINVLGETVTKTQTASFANNIVLSALNEGIYFVEIIKDGKRILKKVIVE